MKRIKKFIYLLTAICCVSFSLCSHTRSQAETSVTYLALGDSISTGYKPGGSHFTTECFTHQIAAVNDLSLVSKAMDGNTASGILSQLQSKTLDETIRSAGLITITCGGNDMLASLYRSVATDYNKSHPTDKLTVDEVKTIFNSASDSRMLSLLLSAAKLLGSYSTSKDFQNSLDDYADNLEQITAYIHAKNANVHILVATQYNPYQWFSGYYANLLSEPLDQCIQKLNDTIRSQADKNGYQVVDVYTAFHNSKTRLCNATDSPLELDFHPNVQGHKMISDTFQPVVKELSFTRPQAQNHTVFGIAVGAAVLILILLALLFLRRRKRW